MRKKAYEKPTMYVVQLQHQSQILTASGPDTLSGCKYKARSSQNAGHPR